MCGDSVKRHRKTETYGSSWNYWDISLKYYPVEHLFDRDLQETSRKLQYVNLLFVPVSFDFHQHSSIKPGDLHCVVRLVGVAPRLLRWAPHSFAFSSPRLLSYVNSLHLCLAQFSIGLRFHQRLRPNYSAWYDNMYSKLVVNNNFKASLRKMMKTLTTYL